MGADRDDETREPDAEEARRERGWIAEQAALILREDGFQSQAPRYIPESGGSSSSSSQPSAFSRSSA